MLFPIRDHNPSDRTPYVTYTLMAANILVFLAYFPELSANPNALNRFYYAFGLVPGVSDPLTYVSSIFLHGGWMHLVGNMLFLWIFGDNMEDEMGHIPYLLFYLISGIGASYAHVLSAPGSMIPLVGASGAIAGVMGGYLLMFPRARIDILMILIIIFKVVPVPAWLMLAIWFAIQLFSGIGDTASGGGVAYWAHAGGFLIGLALTLPLWLRRGGPRFWTAHDGLPPHPEAEYRRVRSAIPTVRRTPRTPLGPDGKRTPPASLSQVPRVRRRPWRRKR